jgi:hypothetical protein
MGKAADHTAAGTLHHMDLDAAPARFLADGEFGQEIGQRGRIEQHIHDITVHLDQSADSAGKIIRQRVGTKGVGHHGQHPLLQMGAGRMQTIVDGRNRQSEEGSDVLMRAFVDEEQRRGFAQAIGQFGNCGKRSPGLPALFEDLIRQRLVVGQRFGLRERHGDKLLSPQHAKGVMPDNAPQPARERRGIGQARQRRPCGDEGLLHYVLGMLEVTDQRKRRAECELLKTPGQLDECSGVAAARPPRQLLVIHGYALFTLKVPGSMVHL